MFKFRPQLGVNIAFAYSYKSIGLILCCFIRVGSLVFHPEGQKIIEAI
jgi:hypothetical protein